MKWGPTRTPRAFVFYDVTYYTPVCFRGSSLWHGPFLYTNPNVKKTHIFINCTQSALWRVWIMYTGVIMWMRCIINKFNFTLLFMEIRCHWKMFRSSIKRHIGAKTNFICGWKKKSSLFETIHFVFTTQLNYDMRSVHCKIHCII